MKQEDKELLLRDICARLPYGVKIDVTYSKYSGSSLRARLCSKGINVLDTYILGVFQQSEIYIKPYLFPLSSMTDEQSKVYHELIGGMFGTSNLINFETLTDFFNANHLDYRGLIPMGLANDCTNLNIY